MPTGARLLLENVWYLVVLLGLVAECVKFLLLPLRFAIMP